MILYIVASILILVAYIPLSRFTHWIVRTWGFVRMQTSVLQLLALILIFVLSYPTQIWEWAIVVLLIGTLLFQATIIFPFTSFYPNKKTEPKNYASLRKISLLTANVLQPNTHYDKFKKLVNDYNPDIFLTMESDKKWEKALESLHSNYPYRVPVPLDNLYGMHLYSKYELLNTQVNYLVEKGVPSISTQVNYRKGDPLNLICIHPAPPSPTENETSLERDAELLLIGKQVRELKSPIIVCGDLNDVVWSQISSLFKKMTGLLDPRIGRGLYTSFHADYWFLRFPIDQLFYSDDMYLEKMKRLPHFGSDHFAMYYEICVENGAPDHTDPDLDSETKEEIEERIDEGVEEASKQ